MLDACCLGVKIELGKKSQTDLFQSTIPLCPHHLSDAQRLEWLRLFRSPGIGPMTFRELLNCYGSAETAIHEMDGRVRNGKRFSICSLERAETEVAFAQQCGAHLVALNEPGYPRWLQDEMSAPPLLYVKGDPALANRPAVAIVGSRNASGPGMKFAGQLAYEFGKAGFVVASGLARGIDKTAHEASLAGGTIAVLGGGIDHIYPPQNERLYQQIAETGLLISERPPGFRPQGKDFPRRNRLISGLSLGVVVVEAAQRSGSLTTARFAGEQGRPVFAVPGHPLDPRAVGTNHLLKDGAVLVDSVEDVLEVLRQQIDQPAQLYAPAPSLHDDDVSQPGCPSPSSPAQPPLPRQELKQKVLEILGPTPMDRDSLGRLLKCQTKDLQVVLFELELEGVLECHGQHNVSLK